MYCLICVYCLHFNIQHQSFGFFEFRIPSQREPDVYSVYSSPSMLGSRWGEQFQNGVNGTSLNLSGVDSLGPIDGLKMPDFGQSQIGIVKDFVSNELCS